MNKLTNKILMWTSPSIVALTVIAGIVPLSAFEAHIVNVTAKIERRACLEFETRSFGFWKTHSEVRIYPQTLGNATISNDEQADAVFDLPNNIMMNKLKKQLLALKFNAAFYHSGSALTTNEDKTVDELIADADSMITASSTPSNSELEIMKNFLEEANTAGTLSTCPKDEDDNDNDNDNEQEEEEEDDNNGNQSGNNDDKDNGKNEDKKDNKNNNATTTTSTELVASSTPRTETSATTTSTTTPESTDTATSTTPTIESEDNENTEPADEGNQASSTPETDTESSSLEDSVLEVD